MAGPRRTSQLVGRATELSDLDAELRSASTGELRVVLLLGEPGVGKSRLAREFLSRHSGRSLGLLARAYPLGATASFALWVESLERYLRTLGDEAVDRLCDPHLDDLAALLPSAMAVHGRQPAEAPSRLRLLEALTALVENLSRRKPLVVVFDDIHLADPSSWEALSYVARNASAARALFLLTARPSELEEERLGSEVLLALEQEDLLRRRTLAPLEREELRELAQQTLPADEAASEALVDWLAERSQGNPLFALGLLHGLIEAGGDLSTPRLDAVPAELSERVGSRLRRLDEQARGILEFLAVLGRRVEAGELVQLSAVTLEGLVPSLEQLVQARLIAEEERGRELTYEVIHPLVQETIYQRVSAARRRLLHRQLARSLLAAGRPGEAAGHFARSAEVGDAEAIEALREAVRAAEARGAYREALAIVAALVELVPSGDERWLEVLDALSAEAEWVVDHRADADAAKGIEALREIDALLATIGEPARRATVKFRLTSFLAWGPGFDLDAAEQTCREALELFEQAGDRPGALLAANELAWGRGLRGEFSAQQAEAAEIAETAEAEGHRFIAMQAHGATAFAALIRGRFGLAEQALERSISIAREDEKRYRLTWNLSTLALVRAFSGRIEEAAPLLEEAKAGNPAYRDSILLEFQTYSRWLAGDLTGAIETAREIVAWNPGGLSPRRASGLAFAALAAAETGAIAEARPTLARASSIYQGQEWMVFSHYCTYAEGLLASREGEVDRATETLGDVSTRLLARDAKAFAPFPLVDLAEIAATAGDAETAGEAALRLETLADSLGGEFHRGLAALAAGWASLAAGEPEQAARAGQAAVAALSPTGYRLHHARALELLGRALAGSEERARAVETLEAAVSVYKSCEALWRGDRLLEELRRLGHRGRRAAAAALGAESLTRREREVAQLAARGLTAREIAERLFIGKRTVETHLANAYAKLGVESALQVAQLMRRQGAEAGKRQRIEQELRVAQLIQQNFLPKQLPEPQGWQAWAYYSPAREVGGDFYDFIELPDRRIGIVIGDVTDKGVPAAMVMAATRSLLRGAAHQNASPGALLQRVNEELCPEIPEKMFVTCLYGLVDPPTGRLHFANAGHVLPCVQTENGPVELRATGMPLGLLRGMSYEEGETVLSPGETILFSTDGLSEARGPTGELFGCPRLMDVVGEASDGASELIDRILTALDRFTGEGWEQEDDITLVSLRRTAPDRRA